MVYNSTLSCIQCFLWYELSKISHLHLPWLIIGDFNAVLSRNEFIGGGGDFLIMIEMLVFLRDFVDFNNLLDLNYTGR